MYAAVLATLNTFFPAQKGLVFSSHLSLVTFGLLALYAYRDIWPLMTFTLEPVDSAEGNILWAKLALVAFVGAVLPLLEPYPYIPYDPTVSQPKLTLNAECRLLTQTYRNRCPCPVPSRLRP